MSTTRKFTTDGWVSPSGVNGGTSVSGTVALPTGVSVWSGTLVGNTTFTPPASPNVDDAIQLVLTQDGTGSRTGTFTGVKAASGVLTLSTAAGSIDVVTLRWTGVFWLGTSAKAVS